MVKDPVRGDVVKIAAESLQLHLIVTPAVTSRLLEPTPRKRMERARSKRHPGSPERKAKIAKMYARGLNSSQIAKMLGIKKNTAQRAIRRMIDAGELRERKIINKKNRTSI